MKPRKYFPQAVKNGYLPATVNETGGIDTYPLLAGKWCLTAEECEAVCRERNSLLISDAQARLAEAQAYMAAVATIFEL